MLNRAYIVLLFVFFILSFKVNTKVQNDAEPIDSGIGHGLLVGVERTELTGYKPISGVSRNIAKMKKILRARKFKSVQILDKNPSAREIKTALKNKLKNLDKDDLFVFYFFGHGDQKKDNQSNEEKDSLDEFLVAYDDIILDDDINEILKNSKANGRVVFIIESCHSGSMYEVVGDFTDTWGIAKVQKNSFPNFIYLGATTDPEKAPLFSGGGIYTNKLYRIWKRKKGNKLNYRKFQEKLDKLKEEPVLIDTYASEDFINQLFLKI